MPIKIIHNPYSARWQSAKRLPAAKQALKAAGLEYDLVQSQGPDHAVELASEAVRSGYQTIIAAGGDGTIGEVVNGIMQGSINNPIPNFGVLPLGTANDLVCNLGLPLDLETAAKVIASGITRNIDLCRVNDRYFINNAGLGLEPYTTTVQERIPILHGTYRYLLATIISIFRNPKWSIDLEWDGGEYHGPVTMVSVSNGPQTGGVFYTVPHANPFDGKISFVYGYIDSRIEIFRVLPKVMKPDEGNYVEHPSIHEKHCSWIKVHIKPGSPTHTDGELFDRDIHHLHYSIYPAKIPILMGK